MHKILHRDFKLANLLKKDEFIVIGDFGFAKKGLEYTDTRLGTPLTMAPEILMDEQGEQSYNSKVDLWSIGVVFYEMVFGSSPFFALNRSDIKKKIY